MFHVAEVINYCDNYLRTFPCHVLRTHRALWFSLSKSNIFAEYFIITYSTLINAAALLLYKINQRHTCIVTVLYYNPRRYKFFHLHSQDTCVVTITLFLMSYDKLGVVLLPFQALKFSRVK